jgi:hypothetical protein
VILYAVFFYLRYSVSNRDLEEIMAERSVEIEHATQTRWVVNFSTLIAAKAQSRKKPTAASLTMPIQHHRQADNLVARFEIEKWIRFGRFQRLQIRLARLKPVCSDRALRLQPFQLGSTPINFCSFA